MKEGKRTDVVIVGAGHSGLAMSRCLAERSIDYVVLERGEVANTWKHERWDSLTLLTPNWQSRLPGYAYRGADPDGFMTVPEVVRFIEGYADFISAPVETGTTVTSVAPDDDGYRVQSDRGEWQCRVAVLAGGGFNRKAVPAVSEAVPPHIEQVHAGDYRHPGQLPDGGVLVVGASATGVQLADEIHRSGRPVTLSVGEHVRMPRVYRGRDIFWWLEAAGIQDERYDEVDDLVRARNVASPQLIGARDGSTLDLNALMGLGVKPVGKLAGVGNGKFQFSGSLRNVCNLADLKMDRLLDTLDEWAAANGVDPEVDPSHRLDRTRVEDSPPLTLDIERSGIRSIVWATGFSPDFSWVDAPVLDRKGRIRHQGGVVDAPGMYVLGLTFLRRRKSSFIHGAEDDTRDLAAHLHAYLERKRGRRD